MKKWTLVIAVAALLVIGATDAQAAQRGNGRTYGDGTCQALNDGTGPGPSGLGSMLRFMLRWNPDPLLQQNFGNQGCIGDGPQSVGGTRSRTGDGNGTMDRDRDGTCDGTGTGSGNGTGECDGTGVCDGTGPN